MTEDTKAILSLIDRTSTSQDKAITELSQEIRSMTTAITRGFSNRSKTNGGTIGIVATFTVVIVSLGSLFFSAISGVQSNFVISQTYLKERMTLIDKHQTERAYELDNKLQKEIVDSRAEIEAKFGKVDTQSEHRHEAQQREIDEIKGWFKAPHLKNNSK